jgi:hypothetical protein
MVQKKLSMNRKHRNRILKVIPSIIALGVVFGAMFGTKYAGVGLPSAINHDYMVVIFAFVIAGLVFLPTHYIGKGIAKRNDHKAKEKLDLHKAKVKLGLVDMVDKDDYKLQAQITNKMKEEIAKREFKLSHDAIATKKANKLSKKVG